MAEELVELMLGTALCLDNTTVKVYVKVMVKRDDSLISELFQRPFQELIYWRYLLTKGLCKG